MSATVDKLYDLQDEVADLIVSAPHNPSDTGRPFNPHSTFPNLDVIGPDLAVVYAEDATGAVVSRGTITLTPELRRALVEFRIVARRASPEEFQQYRRDPLASQTGSSSSSSAPAHPDYDAAIRNAHQQASGTQTGAQPAAAKPAPAQAFDYAALLKQANEVAPAPPTKEELVERISKTMIGQHDAIEQVAKLARGKIAAKNMVKPLVILLPGPTGTGKTELSKGLARALGVELVRFDMGEYAEPHKVSNLLGSALGYQGGEDGGALPNAIRKLGKGQHKIFVVLFDEVEKAYKGIWQQLLAFLDEGRVTDSKGTVVAPKNTIVIMTTNLMAEEVGQDAANAKNILLNSGFFSSEMLGRVDKILPLPRLDDEEMIQLTLHMLNVRASQYGVTFAVVDPDALVALFNEARENAYRGGGRGILETISDLLSEDILEIQGEGYEEARLTLMEGQVRAVAQLAA